MSKRKKAGVNKAIRKKTIKRSEQTMFSITMVTLLVVGALVGFQLFGTAEPSKAEIRIAPPQVGSMSVVKIDDSNAEPAIDPNAPLVGIVSGHKGYDPGAVCDDGLSEVEINQVIALEVVSLLNRRDIRADLLDEFDDRLTDYQADALVSIHSDSCNIPGATGFKVARVTHSAIPDAEDQLVACLNQEYGAYTSLAQHPASITDGMTNYHAFNEIADRTPGAIIETGFLLDDRHLLQYRPKVVARGIAAGIICFLDTTAEE